jgi:hypothetical protein
MRFALKGLQIEFVNTLIAHVRRIVFYFPIKLRFPFGPQNADWVTSRLYQDWSF